MVMAATVPITVMGTGSRFIRRLQSASMTLTARTTVDITSGTITVAVVAAVSRVAIVALGVAMAAGMVIDNGGRRWNLLPGPCWMKGPFESG